MSLFPAVGRDRGRQISMNSRPAWYTEWVVGQSGLHSETLSQKKGGGTNEEALMHYLFYGSMGEQNVVMLALVWKSNSVPGLTD